MPRLGHLPRAAAHLPCETVRPGGRLKGEPPRPISPAVADAADSADAREGRL